MTLLNSSDSGPNSQIDCSFTKLFQCMSIAYRQKLTSPKWNRFLGMKLRWKDKIRLNNVIWRCWLDRVPYDPERHQALQRLTLAKAA